MKIFVKKSAIKQLLKIPQKQRVKIEDRIGNLECNPFPRQSRKLAGRPAYRLKIGDYRIIYSVDKNKKYIEILSSQHRKDAYR